MNCCTNCFNDKEIIGFIFTNSTEKGTCDFCHATDVQLIDARELGESFQPVVALYKTVVSLGITVTEERSLCQKIDDRWHLFKLPEASHQLLLTAIVADSIPADDPILNEAVEIEALFNPDFNGNVHEKKWENFAEEIKYKNRFFLTETIDLDLLKKLLESLSKTYGRGKIFYRGRISDQAGHDLDKMGKPPVDKATPGRANPKGIPYLYLSTKAETTIYESRSSYLDYITLAEFKIIEPLKVVSLRAIADASPFVFGEHLSNYIVHQKYLSRLEEELSKQFRRFDKELDYLPSQYLCEYVKSLGYDAIEYGSSMKDGGINIAVFNDEKLEVRSRAVYEITGFNLAYNKLVQ